MLAKTLHVFMTLTCHAACVVFVLRFLFLEVKAVAKYKHRWLLGTLILLAAGSRHGPSIRQLWEPLGGHARRAGLWAWLPAWAPPPASNANTTPQRQ